MIRYLDDLEVNLDLFWFALWKHVLLVEIIRHRYEVNSATAKQHFLAILRDKIKRDPAKQAALDYLDEFQGRFWCETDERVREIIDTFSTKISDVAGASGGYAPFIAGSLSVGNETVDSSAVRTELAARFQRVVNDTQLARLNQMLKVLDEDILDEPQHYT